MANRRQRRKQKSHTYKPVKTTSAKDLRRVPTIQGPAAIRKAWDKKKSLHQNYAALGLALGSRPVSGPGAAPWPTAPTAPSLPPPPATTTAHLPSQASTDLPKGRARIIRDGEGNVVGIEESAEDLAEQEVILQPWEARPLNPYDEEDVQEEDMDMDIEKPKTRVIEELEEEATKYAKTGLPGRPPSQAERNWIVSLVKAHGDDLEAMSRDLKRNVWQRTVGELKKAVKCDRKDADADVNSKTMCSECQARGFHCVDEIPVDKPKKQFRRGRKIQELEPIYGIHNASSSDFPNPTPDPEPKLELQAPPPPSAIPTLQLPFFKSAFYRRFHVQRPVVDPIEFVERYERHVNFDEPLGIYGKLIAGLLATWAASYGVDASGEEEPHDGFVGVERRRELTNLMVRELLASVDKYSIMRTISWDGVRVLLLLMPLTEEVQSPADRSNMYRSTVGQVYSLSNMSDALQTNETGARVNQMVRARIFWYGHVHEGLTNGLKGEKLIFDQDDVDAFRSPLTTGDYNNSLARSHVTNSYTYQYATAPIRLSAACRQVNAVLTGPKAVRSDRVDKVAMNRVWTSLADSWDEFEGLRGCVVSAGGGGGGGAVVQNEDTDRFISGWQIFIFEALNVIREKLSERITNQRDRSRIHSLDSSPPTSGTILTDLTHLHDIAESRCHEMSGRVMDLIKRHVHTPAFFEYDASLCRDGVFYAGERRAGEANSAADVQVCLRALSLMRWGYSKSVQRTEKLKEIFNARQRHGYQPPSFAQHQLIGANNITMAMGLGMGVGVLPPPLVQSSSLVTVPHQAGQTGTGSSPIAVGSASTARSSPSSAMTSAHHQVPQAPSEMFQASMMIGANPSLDVKPVLGVGGGGGMSTTSFGYYDAAGQGSGASSRAGSAGSSRQPQPQPPPVAPPALVDSRAIPVQVQAYDQHPSLHHHQQQHPTSSSLHPLDINMALFASQHQPQDHYHHQFDPSFDVNPLLSATAAIMPVPVPPNGTNANANPSSSSGSNPPTRYPSLSHSQSPTSGSSPVAGYGNPAAGQVYFTNDPSTNTSAQQQGFTQQLPYDGSAYTDGTSIYFDPAVSYAPQPQPLRTGGFPTVLHFDANGVRNANANANGNGGGNGAGSAAPSSSGPHASSMAYGAPQPHPTQFDMGGSGGGGSRLSYGDPAAAFDFAQQTFNPHVGGRPTLAGSLATSFDGYSPTSTLLGSGQPDSGKIHHPHDAAAGHYFSGYPHS